MKAKPVKRIVFCDFDGTITEVDAFVKVCKHFAPEACDSLLSDVMNGKLSLKEGIRQIVESINSEQYPDMLDFVEGSKVRPGFEELLDFLGEKKIPLVVISGGLKGLVERQLGPLTKRVDGIYAADVKCDNNLLEVVSEFEADTELVAKAMVMDRYDFSESVAIGDGITDFKMAFAADTVFARGHLADYLDKKNHPYNAWEDFHDVRRYLESIWG